MFRKKNEDGCTSWVSQNANATTRSLPPEVLERAGLPKSDAKGSDAADRWASGATTKGAVKGEEIDTRRSGKGFMLCIDVLFPLVGWWKLRGLKVYPFNLTGFYGDRWYTSSRPLYFCHFRTLLLIWMILVEVSWVTLWVLVAVWLSTFGGFSSHIFPQSWPQEQSDGREISGLAKAWRCSDLTVLAVLILIRYGPRMNDSLGCSCPDPDASCWSGFEALALRRRSDSQQF